MKKSTLTLVAALAVAGAAPAFAQSDYRAPWRGDFWGYLGVSGGESKFESRCRNTNVFQCDERDTAWRVYAGGQLNRVLGLEVGYTDFGRVRSSGGETNAWAVPIVLTAGYHADRWSVFGKAGGLYSRTDVNVDLNDTFSARGDRNGWGWTYGAGATFGITPNLHLRADLDRYQMDFAGGRRDVDMISGGVVWRF
jgi:OmpA-OmpF porin, OOP family